MGLNLKKKVTKKTTTKTKAKYCKIGNPAMCPEEHKNLQ
jgi:hypothetical protein